MAESIVQVTEGVGKKLHTNQRTIGANNVEDEVVVPGEFYLPTYTVQVVSTSIATLNDHVLQLMAGAALNVRIRSITVEQVVNATAVTLVSFALIRLTTAGTGGTVVTPAKHDTADAASGATAMTLPTVKGTETTEIRRNTLVMRQAIAATGTQPEESILWQPAPNSKPYVIPAGAANGVCIKVLNACAGATVAVTVELVETSFV